MIANLSAKSLFRTIRTSRISDAEMLRGLRAWEPNRKPVSRQRPEHDEQPPAEHPLLVLLVGAFSIGGGVAAIWALSVVCGVGS